MSKTVELSSLRLLRDKVLVADMNFDAKITSGGIILNSDDGKDSGIKPRWGRVVAVGPEQKDVKPGEWILVAHGRWTRGIEMFDLDGKEITARFVDVKEIIMSDDEPHDDY